MGTFRSRVDDGFAALGRMVLRFRWLVLLLSIGICAGFGSFLKSIVVDNSNDSYLHADDPVTILYHDFRRQFGQDELILVAVEPPEVFDLAFLEKLRNFHRDLENELPHIAEVTSLLTARQMRGEDDQLIVEELQEDWPKNADDLARLKKRVMANPLYLDQFISRDGKLTTLVIRPDIETGQDEMSDQDALGGFGDEAATPAPAASAAKKGSSFLSPKKNEEIVVALDAVVARYHAPDFQVRAAGGAYFSSRISKMMKGDLSIAVGAGLGVVLLALLVLFRRVASIVLPVIVVFTTLISTFGAMALAGIPFSVTMQMIPVFLMCVTVCNCVHLLVPIYQNMSNGMEKAKAIETTFRHSGFAILMTTLTTAAGMGSFVTAELKPVADMGLVSCIAVLVSWLFSMLILPALVSILPVKVPSLSLGSEEENASGWVGGTLVGIGKLGIDRPWLVLGGTLLVTVVAVMGIAQLRFSHQPLDWFPKDHEVRTGSEMIDQHLGGTRSIEIVVTTGEENGLHDPAVLKKMEDAIAFAKGIEVGPLKVGKEVSFLDVLKETHQALNGNHPEFYAIPADRALVAQELLLFENSGSDDLEPLVDSQFSTGRISLRIPTADRVYYEPFLQQLNVGLEKIFGQDLTWYVTGVAPLIGQIFVAMVHSMATSYLVSFAVIIPLMMILIGSFRIGLVSMVPNIFPIVCVLGVMGWAGLPLDTSTILIGSILIGLAVDDTIHIMHHFHRYYGKKRDVDAAFLTTLRTSGLAILFTSILMGSGFIAIGASSTMSNMVTFGYLAAFGIGVAFLADILVSPALLKIIYGKK
jgi:predicted RND superfamily exporter protein